MFPFPLAGQLEPAVAVHVQLTFVNADGIVSTTEAPDTLPGPLFVTAIMYVTPCPGAAVVALSVFVIERSAMGLTTTVLEPQLLLASLSSGTAPAGSTAQFPPALGFTREPAAVGVPVTGTLNEPPDGIVTAPLAAHVNLLLAIEQLIAPMVPPALITAPTA